jgi:hypothetical protein
MTLSSLNIQEKNGPKPKRKAIWMNYGDQEENVVGSEEKEKEFMTTLYNP